MGCRDAVAWRWARALAVAWLASQAAAPAWAIALTWSRVLVEARLDDDGVLHVREHLDVTVHEPFQTLERVLSRGPEQRLTLRGVHRVDAQEQVQALVPGDLSRAHQYVDHGVSVHWSLHDAGAPAPPAGPVRYRVDYEIRGAVVPAWDLPYGSRPFEFIDAGFISPVDRWREVWPAWQEALHCMRRCYRLDHDVWFPNRDWPNAQLLELSYRLHYGQAWTLLAPQRELAIVTPDVNYRVQRSFEYLREGVPPGVDPTLAIGRMGSLPALALGALVLWLLFGLAEAWLRWRHRMDRDRFAALVAAHPPELVRWHVAGQVANDFLDRMLDRWVADGVLSVRELPRQAGASRAELVLTLRADLAALHPAERSVIDLLFGGRREVTSREVREMHHWTWSLAEREALEILRQQVQPPAARRRARRGRIGWRIVSGLLAAAGLAAVVLDTAEGGRAPYGLVAGLLAGGLVAAMPASWWHGGRSLLWFPVWSLPIALALALFVAAMLVPTEPIGPRAALGMAALVLAGCASLFARTLAPQGTPEAAWWTARGWALRQLRREAPELDDRWLEHLDALGLAPAVQRWRDRRQAAALQGHAPSVPSSQRPFTGLAAATPARAWRWSTHLADNPALDEPYDGDFEDEPEDGPEDAYDAPAGGAGTARP